MIRDIQLGLGSSVNVNPRSLTSVSCCHICLKMISEQLTPFVCERFMEPHWSTTDFENRKNGQGQTGSTAETDGLCVECFTTVLRTSERIVDRQKNNMSWSQNPKM